MYVLYGVIIINPQRACVTGLQLLCVCVCVCVCPVRLFQTVTNRPGRPTDRLSAANT